VPLFYFRTLVQLGIATDLAGLRRYQEALVHADAALAMAPEPQNGGTPAPLKAMVCHARGAILYNLGRRDEARAMFDLAAREGDADAAGWLRTLGGAP
jgi:tetratricopeptide (TPR) repeat protein